MNTELLASIDARGQLQLPVHRLEHLLARTPTVFHATNDCRVVCQKLAGHLQRNDVFRIAQPALALLFGAGHAVLTRSIAARVGNPEQFLDQQLTALNSLLELLDELHYFDSMLAVLAPPPTVLPWLRDATAVLQASPTGMLTSHACHGF
jgi:hypothetical protein